MKLRTSTRNQSGFTLIELMVGVAIAGLLVAIAVPSYCKFESKAKQAQAKSTLSAIFSAEQAFVVQTTSYTACLGDIGISAALETPTAYYAYGFNPAMVTSSVCGPGGNQPCLAQSWTPFNPCTTMPPAAGGVSFNAAINRDPSNLTIPTGINLYPTTGPAPGSFVTNTTFYAMAVGNISSCNSAYDKWTINQGRTILNDHPAL